MKVLIVEDEAYSRQRIKKLLSEVSWIEEIGESENGRSAVTFINEHHPDIIFLDINLQDMTGFEVLQKIDVNPKPIVIFVTAHDYHAPKAFDFDAFDFLLKPFKNERFFKTMEKVQQIPKIQTDAHFDKRVQELIKLHQLQNHQQITSHKLPIKLGNKTILLDVDNIHYITASGYYAEIFTADNKFLTRESLNHLSSILDDKKFFRVHRSHIINLNFIQEIVHSDYSEIDVRMKDKNLIRVSKSQKKEFLKKLGVK